MRKYKVGDKILIKTYEEIEKAGEPKDSPGWCNDMKNFCGKTITVTKISDRWGPLAEGFYWHQAWIASDSSFVNILF